MAYKLDGSGNLVGDDGKLVQIDGTNIVLSGYKTQEEVNSGLKDRLDRAAKKYETRIAQLEEEADDHSLSNAERDKLKARIDELKTQNESAGETVARESKLKIEAAELRAVNAEEKNGALHSKLRRTIIENDLVNAAASTYIDPQDAIDKLMGAVEWKPEVVDGKETGNETHGFKIVEIDKETKREMPKVATAAEAVAHLGAANPRFLRGTGTGGAHDGADDYSKSDANGDIDKMSTSALLSEGYSQ